MIVVCIMTRINFTLR